MSPHVTFAIGFIALMVAFWVAFTRGDALDGPGGMLMIAATAGWVSGGCLLIPQPGPLDQAFAIAVGLALALVSLRFVTEAASLAVRSMLRPR